MKTKLTIEDLQLSNSLIALNAAELRQVIGGVNPTWMFSALRKYDLGFNSNTTDGAINVALSKAASKLAQEGNVDRGREFSRFSAKELGQCKMDKH